MSERLSIGRMVGDLVSLLEPRQRRRFVVIGLLAAGNALLEAVAAGFVLALVGAATNDRGTSDPVGHALRALLPNDASQRTVLLTVAFATLGFYVFKNVSAIIEDYLQQRMVHRTAAESSTTIVGRYLRVPLELHYTQRSGDMLQQAWTATENVFRNSLLAAVTLVSEGLAALALLVVLVVAAPLATGAVTLSMGLLVGLIYRVLRRPTARWSRELQEHSMGSFQTMQESFGAVRDARILGTEEYFVDRYRRSRTDLARTFWRSSTATNAPRYLLEAAFIGTMVIAVLILSKGGTQQTSVSVLGLYAYAGLRVMPSLNRVLFSLSTIRLGGQAVDDVRAALALPAEDAPTGTAVPSFVTGEILLDDLTYQHLGSEHRAVAGLTLAVAHGETLGIVGPSGSGKSTLVDLLAGLLRPQAGRVVVDGVEVSRDVRSWRAQIGYVSQSSFLLDDSVRVNVAFGLPADEVDDERVWEVLALARVDDFVRTLPLQLDTTLGERGVRLSGGQRQRLAIARALYRDPKVLVFDEATSALDNRTEDEIVAALEALSHDRTVLVVAHRLTTVRACDRIAFMVDGRLVACDTFERLVEANEDFRRFVSTGDIAG